MMIRLGQPSYYISWIQKLLYPGRGPESCHIAFLFMIRYPFPTHVLTSLLLISSTSSTLESFEHVKEPSKLLEINCCRWCRGCLHQPSGRGDMRALRKPMIEKRLLQSELAAAVDVTIVGVRLLETHQSWVR